MKLLSWNRYLILLGSLLMVSTYFFPLWQIQIWAPQYPEGLSMQIWSYKFSGDVTTINILNHYIGMQQISVEHFKELIYFPYFFGVLIIFGLLVGSFFYRNPILLRTWVLSVFGFAFYALYDFWQWEYQFGHNLSEDAPIKMEDMVYQPPLIGSKEFLNIQASSWPDIAGYAFSGTVLIGILILVLSFWTSHRETKTNIPVEN